MCITKKKKKAQSLIHIPKELLYVFAGRKRRIRRGGKVYRKIKEKKKPEA